LWWHNHICFSRKNYSKLSKKFIVKQLDGLHNVSPKDWNNLIDYSNPFLRHEYLYGLEKHYCLNNHGWLPCHLVVYRDKRLVGALPLYARSNSYGEFVFDWAWANAYEQNGKDYYPKLVTAIPYAPVCGPRYLVNSNTLFSERIKELLLEKVLDIVKQNNFSSYHCLFTNNNDHKTLSNSSLIPRSTCQFRWHNNNYQDFNDFLSHLTSKKRKQIKRERKYINDNDIKIEVLSGESITKEKWILFYEFYCSTFYRKWGNPRLTLDFFIYLGRCMPSETILIFAKSNDIYIAGAFLMRDQSTLYGRHWGCSSKLPYLHFELCYYYPIEYCINNKIRKLDAGVQGEHKIWRGFEPYSATSYHWIEHLGFRKAIKDYLDRETTEIDSYIENLKTHLPFKDL